MRNEKIELDSRGRIKRNGENLGKIFWKTGGRCAYCGEQLDPFGKWAIEHSIPQSKGGTHDYINLWPACRPCNSSKNTLDPEEFRQAIKERMLEATDKIEHAIGRTYGDSPEVEKAIRNLRHAIRDCPIVFLVDMVNDEKNE